MRPPEQLGERIARLRRAAGWSQGELGRRVGLKANQISKYERGAYEPRVSVLARIAEALETTADYLLAGRAPVANRLQSLWSLTESLPEEQRANLVEFLEALFKAHCLIGLGHKGGSRESAQP